MKNSEQVFCSLRLIEILWGLMTDFVLQMTFVTVRVLAGIWDLSVVISGLVIDAKPFMYLSLSSNVVCSIYFFHM